MNRFGLRPTASVTAPTRPISGRRMKASRAKATAGWRTRPSQVARSVASMTSSAASGVAASSSCSRSRAVARTPHSASRGASTSVRSGAGVGKNAVVPPGRNETPTTCSCSEVSMITKRVATPPIVDPGIAWQRPETGS